MKQFSLPLDKTIQPGDWLVPDGWRNHHLGSRLRPGDAPVDTSYHGSQYRVETGDSFIPSLPVNIYITGRVMVFGKFSHPAVRVKIEWVHDGEPNETSGGWLVFTH